MYSHSIFVAHLSSILFYVRPLSQTAPPCEFSIPVGLLATSGYRHLHDPAIFAYLFNNVTRRRNAMETLSALLGPVNFRLWKGPARADEWCPCYFITVEHMFYFYFLLHAILLSCNLRFVSNDITGRLNLHNNSIAYNTESILAYNYEWSACCLKRTIKFLI